MGEEELIGSGLGQSIQDFASDVGGKLWNKAMSERQMNFQERMSNTAHAREMRDLKRAGLNPILGIAKGGSGASSPSGSMSQSHSAGSLRKDGLAELRLTEAMTREHNSGAELKETEKDDMLFSRDSRLQMAILQLDEIKGRMGKNNYEVGKIQAEIDNLEEQRKLLRLEQSHSALDMDRAKAESQFYRGPGGKVKPYTQLLPFWNSYQQGRR